MEELYDAHAHLGEENEQITRMLCNIHTLLCGTNPASAAEVVRAAGRFPILTPTFGLHPWYAHRYAVEEMFPFFAQGGIIGEIGMDSVWCDVPLDVQRRVFIEQLDFAEAHMRPIILHTKGQEREIAEIIEGYSMPVLVHWYSCEEHLDRYLERGCYFTVGPDVRVNPAVRQVAGRVPLDRILVESDGLNAVRWALGGGADAQALVSTLKDSTAYIAEAQYISMAEARRAIAENFHRFIRGG